MRGLVTGASGFIGSHLVDRLAEQGWETRAVDRRPRRFGSLPEGVEFRQGDLLEPGFVEDALDGVDVVFHLGWASIHESSNRDPGRDVAANVLPSLRLLDGCRGRVGRVVFLSSGGTVYGPTDELPIAEDRPTEPVSAYGVNKLTVEKYLRLFQRLHGLDFAVVRASAVFGPRQHPLSKLGAVTIFLHRVARRQPLTIWGEGVTRDFLFVSDLVDALMACAGRESSEPRIFNAGGGREISLEELVRRVEAATGENAIVERQPARPFDARRLLLDNSLALSELGWRPRVGFDTGLEATWSWLAEMMEKGRID